MDDARRTACKAAGEPGALFHDLRRSFALDMHQLGLGETDILELAGWKTSSMVYPGERQRPRGERGRSCSGARGEI